MSEEQDDAIRDQPATRSGLAGARRSRPASARTIIGNYWREHSLRQIGVLFAEQYLGLLVRYLPGFEGIAIRSFFYRMLFARLDGFAFIYPGAWLDHSWNISSGRSLSINTGAFISARAPVTFGNGVLVGPNVVMVSSNHRFDQPDRPISEQGHELAPITIGDDCWIGANAVILGGVSLAEGTIVSAGSVVTRDTEPYTIVAGSPAKCIRSRPRT